MRKIVLSLAAVFTVGFATAQVVVEEDVIVDGLVSSKGEYYLPQAGDWSIGFDAGKALTYIGNAFNGAGATATTKNDGNSLLGNISQFGFVGKIFETNNQATRYTANFLFGYGSDTNNTVANTEVKSSSMDLGLVAGYGKEWRKGRTRLQGYYGADGLLLLGKSSSSVETTVTTGSTSTVSTEKTSNPFSFGIGAKGFVGVEYFVFPKVSLGAQYEYTVSLLYSGKGERTSTSGGSSTTVTTSGSGFDFALGDTASNGVGVASIFLNFYF